MLGLTHSWVKFGQTQPLTSNLLILFSFNTGLVITLKMVTGGSHGYCEKMADFGCKLLCERDNLESHLLVKTGVNHKH